MIKAQGLNKYFNKGRQNEIHVINNINIEIPERGLVAIFGQSGCGKTTLLNVIGGLDKFENGSLTIEGQNIRSNTDVIRNKYIGYIFQNYNLNKNESCFNNVADALKLCGMTDNAEIERRVMAALENVGMEKYSKRPPDTLSGGQQQRIAIARAIVKNPRIILADEPTGNLDEANTVMIMDLLKAISKDHLVLLVTHEANLVDYYCDTVIELSDGQVKNIRNNSDANGFTVKDKNAIYLGELEKSELRNNDAEIEYYGPACDTPVKLKIINNAGKLYIQINTPKVQVLDNYSEIKLHEGVYEQTSSEKSPENGIDMSKLPTVQGTRFGNLFSFKSSVKSGYFENFKKRQKGKKLLRRCMCLFAAVIVFMSSVFGVSVSSIIKAKDAYNHNVFYVRTDDGSMSEKLNNAVGDSSTGIDFITLQFVYPYGDDNISFRAGLFETFDSNSYMTDFMSNAVCMDFSVGSKLPVAAGTKDNLSDYEILITTKVADKLIEKTTLGYIKDYGDLIGLLSDSLYFNNKSLRIAGVVQSDETAIYLSELALAKRAVRYNGPSSVFLASDYGIEVSPGETKLIYIGSDGISDSYTPGKNIKINGADLKIVSVNRFFTNYENWCVDKGIKKLDKAAFFSELQKKEQSSLSVEEIMSLRLYEYYEYFFTEYNEFIKDYYNFRNSDFDLFIAIEKGIEDAVFSFMMSNGDFIDESYFKACEYKKIYGRYPSESELQSEYSNLPFLKEKMYQYYDMYSYEFSLVKEDGMRDLSDGFSCFISDKDYIAFSKRIGDDSTDIKFWETGNTKDAYNYNGYYDYYYGAAEAYTVIHSNDAKLTKKWIEKEFSDMRKDEFYPSIVTPDDIFDNIIESDTEAILSNLISMIVILAVMSVCMYFIMRSSLMNRIKEIGIYRAIGVSKKNLLFKFCIESVVLTTLTVFIGYLITSAFIFVCFGISSLVETVLFYPIWYALIILAILYALCIFCGTLPIMMLLHKTPSEILAKYDI